jgi:hypothetical protein
MKKNPGREITKRIDELIGRMKRFNVYGSHLAYSDADVEILKNDIREFARTLPESETGKILEILRYTHLRGSLARSSDHFWTDYGHSLTTQFELIKHRIARGQVALEEPNLDILIDPKTPHSAYVALRQIIETVQSDIMMVDAWMDRILFDLLTNLKSPSQVRFLTRADFLPGDFAIEAKKFGQQYNHKVEVRIHPDVHDRYLLVDGAAFATGASFKDFGRKMSYVMKVKDMAAPTISMLEKRWQEASPSKRAAPNAEQAKQKVERK